MTYKDCDVYLTTKHNKQQVIAPVLANELAANLIVCELDTDRFGTFSGEVVRKFTALETARQKCLLGLSSPNRFYGLASEGSFGPHPNLHFLPCDTEILYFKDSNLGFELYESVISLETNYKTKVIRTVDELLDFSKQALYPSHGLIIRANNCNAYPIIYKGIRDDHELLAAFHGSIKYSSDSTVLVETDMRAHMNPTRMSVISELSKKLFKRLKNLCANCEFPGWGVVNVETGLECLDCGLATDLVKYEIWGCVKCSAKQKLHRSDLKHNAEPTYCSNCNP
jgi:hypothetical protein